MRTEIKEFGTIVHEVLSEICEDPTYARFTVCDSFQIPGPFLAMLLIQFCFIVIDRALYLKKCVVGKLIFQIFLVIGIHVWIFFILPYVTQR